MLRLTIETHLAPRPDDSETTDLVVATCLDTSAPAGLTREPLPEGFRFHRRHLGRRVRKSKRPWIGL